MKKMNNKGFSLIELIIVIAIMAVLVAIIAPNLTKYLGKSKKNTDSKNADEIASQIATCIADFETAESNGQPYGYVWSNSTITLTWGASGVTVANSSRDGDFAAILNQAITTSTASKEITDTTKTGAGNRGGEAFAYAEIVLKDGTDPANGYKITVYLGKASTVK